MKNIPSFVITNFTFPCLKFRVVIHSTLLSYKEFGESGDSGEFDIFGELGDSGESDEFVDSGEPGDSPTIPP